MQPLTLFGFWVDDMILRWKNPLVRLARLIRVRGVRSCIWCGSREETVYNLGDSQRLHCSVECQKMMRKVRRIALGINTGKVSASDLKELRKMAEAAKARSERDRTRSNSDATAVSRPRTLKLGEDFIGPWQGDALARNFDIPRLLIGAPMPVGAICHYCGAKAGTRDHIVPHSVGGSNQWWNLVPACAACNQNKGAGHGSCRCLYCERARRVQGAEVVQP